ncbi:MAG: carboxylesterase/lipase family protein [Bryobacterales bacterium]|nr:carboxylesterase/lipase family protein [Bryobacterales bacterium]
MTQNTKTGVGRREILTGAAALAASGVALSIPAQAAGISGNAASRKTILTVSDSSAVAETTAGKVRGSNRNGIFTFKGIPYAGDTGGEARFLPPTKAKAWTGVRSSLTYGRVCPQSPRAGWDRDENAFMFEWDDGQPGEDCLRVNIWTPGLKDNRKRPVLFWIHGGGFTAGSGQELKSYDGENLSRRGDAVVVSINHRLNVLGYLNLAAYGQRYAESANVGMLDIVASLEWVRDNVANFGGDPGNIMIFGQSGGGAKVSALMAMPAAKGLFHKAAVLSGSNVRAITAEYAAEVAAGVLAELEVSGPDQLTGVPYTRLLATATSAQRRITPPRPGGLRIAGIRDSFGFGATVDGKVLPHHPFDPAAPAISANIPLLIGHCSNEFTNGISRPDWFSMSVQEMETQVAADYGSKSAAIIAAYRGVHPHAKACDLVSYISTGAVRYQAVVQAGRKAAQNAGSAYLYQFHWQTPVLDGRPGAFHCADLPFVFDNTDRCAAMTGGTPEARELGARISEAFLQFARKGNPNHKDLPFWPVYQPGNGATMFFDNRCEVKNDPDRQAREMLIA